MIWIFQFISTFNLFLLLFMGPSVLFNLFFNLFSELLVKSFKFQLNKLFQMDTKKTFCKDFYFLKSLKAFGPPLAFVKGARKHIWRTTMIWISPVANRVVWLKLTQRERDKKKKKGYIYHSSCLADLQFSKSTLLFSFIFKDRKSVV